jgi:phosphoribosylformimino-5-aminoimidazole carboxamide ribotide isomerase
MFKIIPVIDLLNGEVVHAKQGNRQHYLPIKSQLTSSTHPMDIVSAFKDTFAFDTLYIADLNAIQQQPIAEHLILITRILEQFPKLEIWLDQGEVNTNNTFKGFNQSINPMVGSESLHSMQHYNQMTIDLNKSFQLSLDYFPSGYKGPKALIESSAGWPQNVVVMSLNHVGSKLGIDASHLKHALNLKTHHQIFAAGGVQDYQDIITLQNMGVNGALVASALHNKQLAF